MTLEELLELLQKDQSAQALDSLYRRIMAYPTEDRQRLTISGPFSAAATKRFLKLFYVCLAREKASKDRQLAVLLLLQEGFRGSAPLGSDRWHRFLFDVCLRIREPKIINQHQTDTCGFVSCLISWARVCPVQYATFLLDLMRKEEGRFGPAGTPIQCTRAENQHFPEMSDCDWYPLMSVVEVMTGQVRSGFARVQSKIKKQPVGGLYSGELVKLLQAVGYCAVEDRTFSYLYTWNSTKMSSLLAAVALTTTKEERRKHIVVVGTWARYWGPFLGAVPLYDEKHRSARKPAWTLTEDTFQKLVEFADQGVSSRAVGANLVYGGACDHWVVLRSGNVSPVTSTIKVVTYGYSFKVTLPTKCLIEIYGGYVVAKVPQ